MILPSVKNLAVAGKKVLLRANYDVPLKNGKVVDSTRIEESLKTINYLLARKAKIIIISHLGRPAGKVAADLGLRPVAEKLGELLEREVFLAERVDQVDCGAEITLLENLRFWSGEEENDSEFVRQLADLADFYVNEAFAASHRDHASIVGVPRLLSAAFGFGFLKEIEVLTKVKENPCRPVVLILGGEKKDKIDFAKKLIFWADLTLVGGKLVEYDDLPQLIDHPKVIADLIKEGQDITPETAQKFVKLISQAKTIVWSGPMGNFYDQKYILGTKEIALAVVKSGAFTVVGGGDTEVALEQFGLADKINFISSGGGAMLAFLSEGTLPGIEAIKHG